MNRSAVEEDYEKACVACDAAHKAATGAAEAYRQTRAIHAVTYEAYRSLPARVELPIECPSP